MFKIFPKEPQGRQQVNAMSSQTLQLYLDYLKRLKMEKANKVSEKVFAAIDIQFKLFLEDFED
jgi:hypothetical protein